MKTSLLLLRSLASLAVLALLPAGNRAAETTLVVHAADRASMRIPRFLTGKFAEHLGNNIYNGMDAQILRNPTFAAWPFATGLQSPDGIATFQYERERISQALREQAGRTGWPAGEREARAALLAQICRDTEAEPVQLIGRVAIIYQPSDKPKIQLPA